MKNKVIRNFLMFITIWMLIIIGLNLSNHRAVFANFPWGIILMFLLALILVVTNISKLMAFIIDFVVFFIYMLMFGGYYNVMSLIIFAGSAIAMSLVTFFVGAQFKKGEHLEK